MSSVSTDEDTAPSVVLEATERPYGHNAKGEPNISDIEVQVFGGFLSQPFVLYFYPLKYLYHESNMNLCASK